jgi:hypothetical protein
MVSFVCFCALKLSQVLELIWPKHDWSLLAKFLMSMNWIAFWALRFL